MLAPRWGRLRIDREARPGDDEVRAEAGILKSNGNIVATDGSQGYENEDDARDMADRVIGGEFKDHSEVLGLAPRYSHGATFPST
jgi:hypothetical protein